MRGLNEMKERKLGMSVNLVHYFHAEYYFKPSSLTWIPGGNFNNSSTCVVLRFLKGLEQK